MKLIKKLLIPWVALISLFGFSFADWSISCTSYKPCSVSWIVSNLSDYCFLECSTTSAWTCTSWSFSCVYYFNNIDLSNYWLFWINQNSYYIKSSSNLISYVGLYKNWSFGWWRSTTSNINNNIVSFSSFPSISFTCWSYITWNLCTNWWCRSPVKSVSNCDQVSFNYSVQSNINYVDLPAINQNSSWEYFIGGAVSNKIWQSTSQWFSSLLKLLIQLLPYLIFIFIIGYIIRKVLIRFGMLKWTDWKIWTSIPKNNILNRKKYKWVVKK